MADWCVDFAKARGLACRRDGHDNVVIVKAVSYTHLDVYKRQVVGSTGDGAEALRLVEERKPDLLILDTVLPGMDGFGLLSRLPELGGPRAIVLSGFFSDRAATEALRLGAEYYLSLIHI